MGMAWAVAGPPAASLWVHVPELPGATPSRPAVRLRGRRDSPSGQQAFYCAAAICGGGAVASLLGSAGQRRLRRCRDKCSSRVPMYRGYDGTEKAGWFKNPYDGAKRIMGPGKPTTRDREDVPLEIPRGHPCFGKRGNIWKAIDRERQQELESTEVISGEHWMGSTEPENEVDEEGDVPVYRRQRHARESRFVEQATGWKNSPAEPEQTLPKNRRSYYVGTAKDPASNKAASREPWSGSSPVWHVGEKPKAKDGGNIFKFGGMSVEAAKPPRKPAQQQRSAAPQPLRWPERPQRQQRQPGNWPQRSRVAAAPEEDNEAVDASSQADAAATAEPPEAEAPREAEPPEDVSEPENPRTVGGKASVRRVLYRSDGQRLSWDSPGLSVQEMARLSAEEGWEEAVWEEKAAEHAMDLESVMKVWQTEKSERVRESAWKRIKQTNPNQSVQRFVAENKLGQRAVRKDPKNPHMKGRPRMFSGSDPVHNGRKFSKDDGKDTDMGRLAVACWDGSLKLRAESPVRGMDGEDYKFPAAERPEVAFIGDSNIGKSSLINAITKTYGLAPAADDPGLTRTIRWYKASGLRLDLVDLPGYGDAKGSDFSSCIIEFIATRKALRCLYILVDAGRGFKTKDFEFLADLGDEGPPRVVVMTKTDLYTPKWLAKSATRLLEQIKQIPKLGRRLLMVSSREGQGMHNFRMDLCERGEAWAKKTQEHRKRLEQEERRKTTIGDKAGLAGDAFFDSADDARLEIKDLASLAADLPEQGRSDVDREETGDSDEPEEGSYFDDGWGLDDYDGLEDRSEQESGRRQGRGRSGREEADLDSELNKELDNIF